MTQKPVPNTSATYAMHSALDLHRYIEAHVREAIRSSITYEAKDEHDFGENMNIWTQLVTDRIIEGFKTFLPEPIDIEGKYEVKPRSGVHVSLSDNNLDKWDGEQLSFLAKYADDEGYNRYHNILSHKLDHIYRV